MQPAPALEGATTEWGLVGGSPQIQRVLRVIHKLRLNTPPVLITGESGVGKELVASALHRTSPLAGKPFVVVDAATLVGSLMESELFGHVKGAFTGAIDHKQGLVRAAAGGTLFLDEIGELPAAAQAKLLRLLQEQEVRPVGATAPIKIRVRVLAATNRDLAREVKTGRFREDLYYRLRVVSLHVPPLRERKGDIVPLARHFIRKHALCETHLSNMVIERMLDHDWPGNVRELENAVRAMVALNSNPVLQVRDLPSNLRRETDQSGQNVILPLAEVERRHILHVLESSKGDIDIASRLLGISRSTLYRKLKQYRREPAHQEESQQWLFPARPA